MRTVSLKQVKRSMHVDFLRLSATGKGTVWVFALMPLLFVVMGMLSQDEMLMFGFAGSVTAMCALFAGFLPMIVANNEEMSGNSAMNGIIPATRLNQVLARYALMLIVDMLAGVEAMVCLAFLLHADEPPITVLLGIGLVVACMALLVGSLLLPLFYRFPSTQAIGWSFVVLGLLFLAGIVLSRRVPQLGIVTVTESSLMVNVGLLSVASVIGMLLVVLICLISFLISSRIYSNKEL
jgi:hypothetical protein